MKEPQTTSTALHVSRDYFVFSAAHFAVLPDGTTEPLHGHNYTITVEVTGTVSGRGFVIDFATLKAAIRSASALLNHRTIIPVLAEDLTVSADEDTVVVLTKAGKRYELPRTDVVLLEVTNSTVESLSRYLTDAVVQDLPASAVDFIDSFRLRLDESVGQGATTTRDLTCKE